MRYRPLGASGMALSVVSLKLEDHPGMRAADWTALGYAALENGVNSFEIAGRDPAILDGVSVALQSVNRRLVYVSLRLGNTPEGRRDFSASTLIRTLQAAIARSGLEYIDIAMLDDPSSEELPAESLTALKAIRQQGAVSMLGVCGKDDAIDSYILTEAFNVLATPYNMLSGWRDRNRIRMAQERDMSVIGYDFYPDTIRTRGQVEPISGPAKMGLFRRAAQSAAKPQVDPYAFLDDTPQWTAEEVSLGYVLTEPALASVQIVCAHAEHLAALADVPDRDLPSGLGSRVEMARFSATPSQAAAKP